ncbi:hexosaminidase D-like [Homalodisca vitripennis]|uniref:hexosaminidase D-like n=1 Tax=Homalodisca vitripennis TaxID=197043 RepID=UPI001EEA4C72|nr:hexosaminidase D-like [Homalodisca vitripennis]XP_046673116.1 hexosaminidase D-like [Homalodisca vitripennis]XP_046673117.1 hexosaminidase D-like [Homalodisca vitripennis]XP_046673118.1 hexosaminidase D-like [Homalodisca vitripennis]XP_046673119.1 hexosaminidase D-like [Homalodisca vitripennis]
MAASEIRLIHLDLKRAPLKVDFLEKLFPVLAAWGATGLLLEWEDTFPYFGRLAGVGSLASSTPVYSESDVRKIHDLAVENNLSAIPLVQTFGHLEFVLKHGEWRELREVPHYPSSICPSHPLSLPLVTEMLDQMIQLSPAARHIHIGADEVWHLGLCSLCTAKSKERTFLLHVTAVLSHLRSRYPHIRPIMWDDMLRNVDQSVLQEFKIGDLVEPMVWHYQPAQTFSLTKEMWHKYSQVFPRIWLASAFKGATGSCQLLPVISHHVSNHQQWLATQEQISDRFQQVCGIAFTGWSRYDHYATLCELLPPSLPSLALCIQIWLSRQFNEEVFRSVSKQLGYTENSFSLNPYPRPQPIPKELGFPGWKVAVGVEWLANLRAKQNHVLDSDQIQTWLNPWQIENNFTNPMQIESLHSVFKELEQEWQSLERYLLQHLPEVYYERTISEWVSTLVAPCTRRLREISEATSRQLQINS